ncbi:hypothetical protein BDM02DRAFT_3120295 [Thelephora ganbajun]|uniref:Uncharacterized protein n=1 Tax=Thelephora ganbajun TaxID=370292 RepID=A0ACB6Z7X8_THEGA|nr:hypothetical protein BDM02DRAFT_3120295 [Thelephora ganbajun]
MGKDQQPVAGSSKTDKNQKFRFSRAAKTFLKDYFHNTSKAPKKKERERILAHLKELGDTEVTDLRISNWFIYTRREEKKHSSLQLPISVPESNEKKWVDARHKSRKSLIP